MNRTPGRRQTIWIVWKRDATDEHFIDSLWTLESEARHREQALEAKQIYCWIDDRIINTVKDDGQ